MKSLLVIVITALLIVTSCNKDKQATVTVTGSNGVYIINQGNYGFGNAEISFYRPDSGLVVNNLFKGVNNYSLGDVAQSMFIKDSLGFIVVNNSQKIEVVKIPSFQHVRTITILNSSPRYFIAINDSLAYVTELYKSKIHVINYMTGALLTEIAGVATWTEHMILNGSTAVVEEQNFEDTTGTGSLAVINTATNSFVQRYRYPGGNVNGIAKDAQGHIWIALDEDSTKSITASLCCLNSDMSINKSLGFPMGHHPSNLCIDGTGTQLYFFDSDIYSVSTSSNALPVTPFSPGNGRNFYALGVAPLTGDVYAADVLDYVQPSRIYSYDRNGGLIQTFTAGVITGNFTFRNE